MAFINRYTGAALVAEFTPEGGSLVVISGDQKAVSLNESMGTVDATAANETAKSFLTTHGELSGTIEILAGDEAVYKFIKPGSKGRLDVYPKGKTSGMPKRACNVIFTTLGINYPFDNVADMSFEFIRSGDWIWTIGDTV